MGRRKSNRLMFCVLLTLGLALSPGLAGSQTSEVKSFPSVPGDTLIIQNDYGRVQVEAWDSDRFQVEIRRIARGPAQLDNVAVVAQKSGSKVFLTAYFYDYDAESVYVAIQAPRYANLVVWGANPAVEITGLEGYVRTFTQTGLITATDLTASVSLSSETGDILFRSRRQPEKDIRLESIRGQIQTELPPGTNVRGWLRAGGRLSWNGEVELNQGHLEKQLGVGGPLLYASSQEGSVGVKLNPDLLRARAEPPAEPPPVWNEPPLPQDAPEATAGSTENSRDQYPPPDLQRFPDGDAPPVYSAPEGDAPASEGYSLKVDVNWIYLNTSVRDRNTNRSVPNLRQDDFEVSENGDRQTVEKFESTEAPFSLLLLLDVSGSTKSYLDLVKEASIQFTRQIKPNDRIAIAAFNSNVRLVENFTNDRSRVARAIERIRSGGGTAFYDALDVSVRDYMANVEGRTAIVVFTDGVDNQLTGDYSSGSSTSFRDLYRSIQEIDSIIYPIFLDTEDVVTGGVQVPRGRKRGGIIDIILGDIIKGPVPSSGGAGRQSYEEAREQLQMIADQTGGRMYSPRDIRDLTTVYREIADDLRIQYTLAYSSTHSADDGRYREIRVRIPSRTDLAVRTRRGYYASRK